MMSLSSCGRDCGTFAGERSGESGLLCGAETADQTGTWNVGNASNMQRQIVNHHAIITMQNTARVTGHYLLLRPLEGERLRGGERRRGDGDLRPRGDRDLPPMRLLGGDLPPLGGDRDLLLGGDLDLLLGGLRLRG